MQVPGNSVDLSMKLFKSISHVKTNLMPSLWHGRRFCRKVCDALKNFNDVYWK